MTEKKPKIKEDDAIEFIKAEVELIKIILKYQQEQKELRGSLKSMTSLFRQHCRDCEKWTAYQEAMEILKQTEK